MISLRALKCTMSTRRPSAQSEDGAAEDPDRLEVPASPYALALWNLIIRPPRRRYDLAKLGPKEFRLWSCGVKRQDITLRNARGLQLKCSHFIPVYRGQEHNDAPRPVIIYLHANASCRLEALPLVPLFLPLGISLFSFDFAGCGESDGEYISLGWYERDDLAECVDYLRKTGKVSAIGLWGRSMGAVTSLLHADRDHSIGGMVLDSPFSSLRQLATELAQSEYLTVKVPTWLLSGALGVGRLRIKSLCNFDIDMLAPEKHVSASFIPALFVAASGDDFIAPHHTQKLYDAYNGDKEFELVEGDHNSPRSAQLIRKSVRFFCRAFRTDSTGYPGNEGSLALSLGFDPVSADSTTDYPMVTRHHREEACKMLATAGASRVWLGERQNIFIPFRIEGALQLNKDETEAGFCVCLHPAATEWGGHTRPPNVLFACVTTKGLRISRATDTVPEVLVETPAELFLGVPVLCVLELRAKPVRLRFTLGAEDSPELNWEMEEEHAREALCWPVARNGEATFFDCALTDLPDSPAEGSEDAALAEATAQAQDAGPGPGQAMSGGQAVSASGAIPTPVHPQAAAAAAGARTEAARRDSAAPVQPRPAEDNKDRRNPASSSSSSYCNQQ